MSFVIGFKREILEVASKIVNKLPFSKKQEDDIVDGFVIVPRHKYTQADLSDLSKKLAGLKQELRSMPDIDIKALQPSTTSTVLQRVNEKLQSSTSSTALQRINAELQDISELHQRNVELMQQRQALQDISELHQINVELMALCHLFK
jgi:hypothetical protein